jgi:predicted glutamine amidotransferase
MCRMFGIAAAAPVAAGEFLIAAPRSLRTLSREHADGWGVARHDGAGWTLDRDTGCAADSDRYATLAARAARLLIAHVRKATVGATALANTHPFRRDGFVFAHNGTIPDVGPLVARCSPAELARIEGATDSERLLAFVLTHITTAGDALRGVTLAIRALHALGDIGSTTFLLSCGSRLYGHRAGRTLYTLARPSATVIASERLTDEPWLEVPDHGLVVLDAETTYSIAA